MQTLANMSGESYKQAQINLEHVDRVKRYAEGYLDVIRFFQHVQATMDKSVADVILDTPPARRTSFRVMNGAGTPSAAAPTNPAKVSPKGPPPGSKAYVTTPPVFGTDIYAEQIDAIHSLLEEVSATVNLTVENSSEKNVNVLLRSSKLCRLIAGCVSILCKSGKDRTSMCVTLEQYRNLVESEAEAIGGQELIRVMRRHGVRRMNVWANTGQSLYAFNSIQCQMLPACFRPPPGTFSGNVVT